MPTRRARGSRSIAGAHFVKRPSTRPFAGISANDPRRQHVRSVAEGHGKPNLGLRRAGKRAAAAHQPHRDSHAPSGARRRVLRRRVRPGAVGERRSDANFYSATGGSRCVLMPWSIRDYHGSGIVRPGPDHIGFEVEEHRRGEAAPPGDRRQQPAPAPAAARRGPRRRSAPEALRGKLSRRAATSSPTPDGVLIDLAEK